jgi:hypothetical protein
VSLIVTWNKKIFCKRNEVENDPPIKRFDIEEYNNENIKQSREELVAISLFYLFISYSFLTMAKDGGVSCLRRSEMIGIGIGELESPPLDSDQVHVLAVDDSLVDRIVIERLLRITSCKGFLTSNSSSFPFNILKALFSGDDSMQSRRLIADGVLSNS